MPRLFPITPRRVIRQVSAGGEVTDERLTYELPEVHPPAGTLELVGLAVSETHPGTVEDAAVGVLVIAPDTHPDPTETVLATVAALGADTHPNPTEAVLLGLAIVEVAPAGADTAAVLLAVSEAPSTPTEATPLTVRLAALEGPPAPADANAIAAAVAELAPAIGDQVTVSITYQWLWANSQVSNTGWSNPANVTDKDSNTAATLSASSSGLGGINSNTTNGTLDVAFPNPNLSWLNIDAVTFEFRTEATTSGIPVGGSFNVAFDHSTDDGGSWVTDFTATASHGATNRTVDLTAEVAGDWGRINDFRARATGSVTSGTGLGVTRTVSWYHARLLITASRTV